MTAVAEKVREMPEFEADGYLREIDAWDVKSAEFLAREEGIGELRAEHWKLICAIRRHYEKTGAAPLCRDIQRETGYTKATVYGLFPPFGFHTAYKLAGLPRPVDC